MDHPLHRHFVPSIRGPHPVVMMLASRTLASPWPLCRVLVSASRSPSRVNSSRACRPVCSTTSTSSTAAETDLVAAMRWKDGAVIRMLHDGDCPLCEREVNMLKQRDCENGRIDFVDIASPSYDPSQNMNLEYEQVMSTIHAIQPDGTVITGIPVFRELYEQVGLGWVYSLTKNKYVGAAADRVYDFWAARRTQVTGRESLEVLLARRKLDEAGRVACERSKSDD